MSANSILWHKRLGHFNYATLKNMVDLQIALGLPEIQELGDVCEACKLGKQTKSDFNNNTFRTSSKLQLIHTDLCGPMHNKSLNGAGFFCCLLMIITDFVGCVFLKTKVKCLMSL